MVNQEQETLFVKISETQEKVSPLLFGTN